MITYVTAFLKGTHMKRSVEEYKAYFEQLVKRNIKIVLFLDDELHWSFPDNVQVYPVNLKDCWVSRYIPDNVVLPEYRSPTDTRQYMMIQNSKPEFLFRALQENPFKTEWFAWIDFGIVHVFRNPDETLTRLENLRPPSTHGIYTAGIWRHKESRNSVCWRFAGGFQVIHRSYIFSFWCACQQQMLQQLPLLTWEVNVWADIEEKFPLGWFAADHNDSIIPKQL